jgi:ribosomal protein S18 acetylase RimI-like enzyme
MTYLTIPLDPAYDKNSFSCGKPKLDDYLHKQANQDIKRKLSICFILPDKNQRIIGYYTLSNDNISQEDLPENIKKKLPKSYTNLPTTLLGRLAVDKDFKGQGIGELLLLDALKRSYDVSNESIGSMAVVVDPLDPDAIGFYNKYGFIALQDSGRMFLPMKTIRELFK